MSMFSMGSLLNSVQSLNNLNITKQYQKKNDSLYEKRQASGYYDKMRESSPELATMQQQVDKMNDEAGTVVEKMMSPEPSMDTIMAKMNAGQELSPAELEHLKKTDPELYSKAVQVAAEKKAYEEKLKNCKTKEDVQRVKLTALSGVMTRVNSITNNPNIPDDKKLEMVQHEGRRAQAINEATAEYVKTSEYAQKPTEAERNAEDKAERIEREEAVNPKEDTASKEIQEETTNTEETPRAEEAEQDGLKAESIELPDLELPGQGDGFDTKPIPLPGEGKSEAAKADATNSDSKPGKVSVKMNDAHEAYRRMMKRR